jgi:hypothetical protein
MKTNNDVWCVAQGDAANSALAWTSNYSRLGFAGKHIKHRVFSPVPSEVTG